MWLSMNMKKYFLLCSLIVFLGGMQMKESSLIEVAYHERGIEALHAVARYLPRQVQLQLLGYYVSRDKTEWRSIAP